jgi:hypothetical protein
MFIDYGISISPKSSFPFFKQKGQGFSSRVEEKKTKYAVDKIQKTILCLLQLENRSSMVIMTHFCIGQ